VSAQSRLGRQIEELIAAFDRLDVRFALIGGLALASHKVIRATQDVDLLTDGRNADNYLRGDERLDLLYASRPKALDLLSTAGEYRTPFGVLRAVSAEGLIAFKLQALVNNPRRTQDLEDIRALIRNNPASLDLDVVRDYFRLFDREALLSEILRDID